MSHTYTISAERMFRHLYYYCTYCIGIRKHIKYRTNWGYRKKKLVAERYGHWITKPFSWQGVYTWLLDRGLLVPVPHVLAPVANKISKNKDWCDYSLSSFNRVMMFKDKVVFNNKPYYLVFFLVADNNGKKIIGTAPIKARLLQSFNDLYSVKEKCVVRNGKVRYTRKPKERITGSYGIYHSQQVELFEMFIPSSVKGISMDQEASMMALCDWLRRHYTEIVDLGN